VTAAVFSQSIRREITLERIFLLLFLFSLGIRLWQLDLKLFHHDEAIHAWFSYRLLTDGVYEYDPMYHGPLLYYVTAAVFALLGDSDITGRLVPAILGALLVPLVYPIYRLGYLNGRQSLIAALFLAISPCMVYFSRFLRNDIFIAFFTLLLLVALLLYLERQQLRYALLASAAFAFGMCAKENMPIIAAIFGFYLIFLVWRGTVRLPPTWKRDLLTAALLALGIGSLLYSSFGQHPDVLITGALQAIEHWGSMHQQQRLGGPPYFYILLFLLYEVPIFALAILGAAQFLLTGAPSPRSPKDELPTSGAPVDRIFNRLVNRGLGLVQRREACNKNEEFTRFCIVWMVISFATYAYIGEKVPWLILHQLLPVIFVAVYRMENWKIVFSIVSAVFLIGMTWHVAFVAEDINEPIVQVQNSEQLREVMDLIDASDRVAVATTHYWPLPWYYRGEEAKRLTYLSKVSERSYYESQDYDLVITHDQSSFESLDGYDKQRYRLNYWFSVYENKDRYLEYYFFRDGKVGSMNWDVFVRTGSPA
jgi:uncharacterized protein (TIGR03663 family)